MWQAPPAPSLYPSLPHSSWVAEHPSFSLTALRYPLPGWRGGVGTRGMLSSCSSRLPLQGSAALGAGAECVAFLQTLGHLLKLWFISFQLVPYLWHLRLCKGYTCSLRPQRVHTLMELEYTSDCIEHRTRVIFPDMPWMLKKGRLLEDGNKLEMPLTGCLVARPFQRLYFSWFILIQSHRICFANPSTHNHQGTLTRGSQLTLTKCMRACHQKQGHNTLINFKYNIYWTIPIYMGLPWWLRW